MDLNQLDTVAACTKGAEVRIKDVYDNLTDISIKVVGCDSPVFRAADQKLKMKVRAAEKRKQPLEGEALEALYIEMMAECTLGWTNLQENGKEVVFSKETAKDIYQRFPLIKGQVYVALFDRALYLGN